jgi:hypothetical protein
MEAALHPLADRRAANLVHAEEGFKPAVAHCIDGAPRYVGRKLHLGTAELYSPKNDPLGRFLHPKQFSRLIELIRPKFPGLVLPLSTTLE